MEMDFGDYYPKESLQEQSLREQASVPEFGSSSSFSAPIASAAPIGETFGDDFNPMQESSPSSSSSSSSFLKKQVEENSDIHSHTSALLFSKQFVIIFGITIVIVFGIGFLMSFLYPTNSKKPWTLKVRNNKTGEIEHVKITTPFYDIVRPDGAPNDEVFKVVWPIIFLLLSFSTSIALNQERRDAKFYFIIFLIAAQFALIFAWIPVFNKEHKPRSALYILVSLIMLGSFTAVLIAGINIYAGAMWAIFIAWLYYALNLNINSVGKYERFVESFLKKYVPILPPPPTQQDVKRQAAIQQASADAMRENGNGISANGISASKTQIDLPPLQ